MKTIRAYLILTVGTLLTALGYVIFIIPANLAPGGVSGIAALIHFATGFPIGLGIAIINIPLFIFAFRRVGRAFFFRSLTGTLLLSLFTDVIYLPAPAPNEPLLSAVFGGAMVGTGLAMTFSCGGSTGGIDILSVVFHQKQPTLSLGAFILIIDIIIVSFSGIVSGVLSALYSLITVFISSKTVDYVQDGYKSARAYFIISEKNDEIAEKIISDLARGATLLPARGAYSKNSTQILCCIVVRTEVSHLRRIVKQFDKNAFVFAVPASEVMGKGFSST